MKITETNIKGVLLIEPRVHGDARGFFMESFRRDALEKFGVSQVMVQDNHSFSAEPGTLRGLHYQKHPRAQTKIIRVIRGSILDVAVDIRKGSPTYGQYVSETLSAENHRQLLVPPGFAHGFITLEANTDVVYKVDDYYSPEHDRNILWCDPDINIQWPFTRPFLSEKDQKAPLLKNADNNFEI